jgi:hypothetical protein
MMRSMFGFGLALVIACCPAVVRADMPGAPAGIDPFSITFDENGNATVFILPNGTPFHETGYLAADHSGVLGGNVLTYDLPEFIGQGGVNILDANGAISDNLYFYNDINGGHMEYTSLVGGGAMADTGVFDFGFNGANEVGEKFVYNVGNIYNGTSGLSTPEPNTLLVMGAGLVAFCGYTRRRRNQAAAAR